MLALTATDEPIPPEIDSELLRNFERRNGTRIEWARLVGRLPNGPDRELVVTICKVRWRPGPSGLKDRVVVTQIHNGAPVLSLRLSRREAQAMALGALAGLDALGDEKARRRHPRSESRGRATEAAE